MNHPETFSFHPEQQVPRIPRYIKKTFLSRKPTQKSLIVSLLGVLFLFLCSQAHWTNFMNSTNIWPAIPKSVFDQHEYWRLFTALFVHADMQHIASNAFMFFIFSFLLYNYFGFIIFPFLSLLLGAFTNYISLLSYPPNTQLVGASGMVYVMAGLWLSLFLGIERRYSLLHRTLRVTAFTLVVLFPSTYEAHVSYRSHAIGLLLGLTFGFIYFFIKKSHIRKYETLDMARYIEDQLDEMNPEVRI